MRHLHPQRRNLLLLLFLSLLSHLPNKVVSHAEVGVVESENQIVDMIIPPSSYFNEPYFIHKIFNGSHDSIESNMKVDPLILQDNINVHNIILESDLVESMVSSRGTLQPLPYISHGPLF